MSASPVLQISPLGFPWQTIDPFLFCVYHDDAYPRGNAQMGPDASLAGRDMGQDFSRKDGWSMYHGDTVPGFPGHPHRGFETVTIVRKGLIDHSDSLGAAARFGGGDVQWLTAGKGVVHSEMFPLLDSSAPNPLELFQIWLNLPAKNKMAAPHFTMLWSQDIPHLTACDADGRVTDVACIAGRLALDAGAGTEGGAIAPLAPPPDSWASQPDSDLAIWTIRMAPGARWTLPAATGQGTRRSLYFFKGSGVRLAGQQITERAAIELQADVAVELVNGDDVGEFLVLQGRPIGEPVAQYGPFVMNTQAEIVQAMTDYRRTQFGGWPWPDQAPVHGRDTPRFARHPDGREERPTDAPATAEQA
ncbi:pirin family protein [Variovorax sp. J22R133]|uniref:pirin family protein n=1 Tax=Variovorax brevis TaxID=3053503 RepID=UPI002574CC80|nr:pirin family protein [Variovorax sp. J22R133]MDM0111790.1 pirin family protein [Variovorax sp. J22R133]